MTYRCPECLSTFNEVLAECVGHECPWCEDADVPLELDDLSQLPEEEYIPTDFPETPW